MSIEPTAWEAAWARFEQGYAAGPPDLGDPGDQVAFAAIFEAEIRTRVRAEIYHAFETETARLKEEAPHA